HEVAERPLAILVVHVVAERLVNQRVKVHALVLQVVRPTHLPERRAVAKVAKLLGAVRIAHGRDHAPMHLALAPGRIHFAARSETVFDALNRARYDAVHGAAAGHRLPQILRDAVLVRIAFADPDDIALIVLLPFLSVAATCLEVARQLRAVLHELLAIDVAVPLTDREVSARVEILRDVEPRDIGAVLVPVQPARPDKALP